MMTITDPGLGLDHYLVRIVQIDDDEDICRTILAEDVLVGASQILTQWMTPQAGVDPMQQRMMMFMPVVLIFVFVSTPSGALIYWLVGNVWRMAQMKLTNYIHPPKVHVIRPAAERRAKRVGGGKTDEAAREN